MSKNELFERVRVQWQLEQVRHKIKDVTTSVGDLPKNTGRGGLADKVIVRVVSKSEEK